MLEIAKDTEFMASIKHPEYTHEENRAFFNYNTDKEEVSRKKKRRGLEEKELALVENLFFQAWMSGHILAPSGRFLYSNQNIASGAFYTHYLSTDHVPEITSVSAAPVVIVTPVNANEENIFILKISLVS